MQASRSGIFEQLIQTGHYIEAISLAPLVLEDFVHLMEKIVKHYSFQSDDAPRLQSALGQFANSMMLLSQFSQSREFGQLLQACLIPAREEYTLVLQGLQTIHNALAELRLTYENTRNARERLVEEQQNLLELQRRTELATKEYDSLKALVASIRHQVDLLQRSAAPDSVEQAVALETALDQHLAQLSGLSATLSSKLKRDTQALLEKGVSKQEELSDLTKKYITAKQQLDSVQEEHQKTLQELTTYLEVQNKIVEAIGEFPDKEIGQELQELGGRLRKIDNLIRAAVQKKQEALQNLRARTQP